MKNTNSQSSSARLFKVSPYLVIPSKVGGFSLYLNQGGNFVLYAEKGELFTDEHKARLGRLGVDHLYIKAEDYPHYSEYLQDHLNELLEDETIPMAERARAWNDATVPVVKEVFDRSLPSPMDRKRFIMVRNLIANSLKFLSRESALRELARFLEHGGDLYRHGMSVMVLTASVLATFIKPDSEVMVAVAMGAMLHDIGKLELPEDLFTRRWDSLTPEEQEMVKSHPAMGVGVCSSFALPQEAIQAILFHHTRLDGSGYPLGVNGDMLPVYVKALALCNEYDGLTSGMRGHRPLTPFEALTRIKANRLAYDPEMLKRLINVLSKADITDVV